MKRSYRLLSLSLAILVVASLSAAAWQGYARLREGYRRLVIQGAIMPESGLSPEKSQEVYHNALAIAFRDALREGKVAAVYFNDSVMGGHVDNEPRTTIAEMLSRLTDLPISPVSGAGYAGVLFRGYAELIARVEKKPRLVIISVNPRSFSDGWFFTPRWMYSGTVAYLRLLAAPPTLGDVPAWLFSGMDDPSAFLLGRLEEKRTMSEDFFQDLNAMREAFLAKPAPGLSPAELDRRRHFIENYMLRVTPDHPMLASLTDTARRLAEAGTTVLFYLTPIDVEGGTELVGAEFAPTVAANSRVIVQALADAGAACLDFTTLLPQDRFVDRDYACEHLDFAGRSLLAGKLADWLRERGFAAPARAVP